MSDIKCQKSIVKCQKGLISLIRFLPFPHLSIMNRTKRMSTPMQRCIELLKLMSPDIASQLPSKAKPISSPLPLNIGLPEFPPVISLLEIKQRCISPVFLSAYLPHLPFCINCTISASNLYSSISFCLAALSNKLCASV